MLETSLNENTLVYRLDADYLYLADISDIHVGNLYHDRKALESFISTVKSVPNMRLIIGGDSTDNATLSSKSSVFEQSTHGIDQIIELKDLLMPIKDQILFVRSGNHGYERALRHNRLIPEMVLAELLEKPFFHGHASAFINVRKNLYVVGTWHNAKKPKDVQWIQSDITFYEHLHKNSYERTVKAVPNRHAKCWSVVDHYDIQSGSFLGWGGYSADKGYEPKPIGTSVVSLSGIKDRRSIEVYDNLNVFNQIAAIRGDILAKTEA